MFSWVQLTTLGWIFPSRAFFRARFIVVYYLKLVLTCNVLVSSSNMINVLLVVVVWDGICFPLDSETHILGLS